MNDEINKARMKYLAEHIEQIHKICDGCEIKDYCGHNTNLLFMWLPKDYKCKAREFLEQTKQQ